jgi:hypothetical protein
MTSLVEEYGKGLGMSKSSSKLFPRYTPKLNKTSEEQTEKQELPKVCIALLSSHLSWMTKAKENSFIQNLMPSTRMPTFDISITEEFRR